MATKRKVAVKRTLKRGAGGYIDEKAMVAVVIDILSELPGLKAEYPELRERIPQVVRLTRKDQRPSLTRPGEQMWEQILRNIRSHIGSHKEIVGIDGGLKLKRRVYKSRQGSDQGQSASAA
jgi:hypothetical protein